MKINPITKKDLTITSRSMRFSWGLFAYESVLFGVFLIAMGAIGTFGNRYYASSNAESFSSFISMFPAVGVTEAVIVALIIPIMTASSIAGEKERQTFDIMLTTQISPMQIVVGKMLSAVVRVMIYVLASIPIMAVGFTIGGISWFSLLGYLLLTIVLALFEASIGVFCSSVCKKTISAIIMSYLIVFMICGLTVLPLIFVSLYRYVGPGVYGSSERALFSAATLCLLPNPVMTFIEFFGVALTGEGILVSDILDFSNPVTDFIKQGSVWISISVLLLLVITLCFMKLAAYIINPLHHNKNK